MNDKIQGKLDALTAPLTQMLQAANAIPALVDADNKDNYDKGFDDGKASIQLPDKDAEGAQYTQAQMSQAVSDAESRMQDKLDAQAKAAEADKGSSSTAIAELQAKLDAKDAEKDQAVAAKMDEMIKAFADANQDNEALIEKYKKQMPQPDPTTTGAFTPSQTPPASGPASGDAQDKDNGVKPVDQDAKDGAGQEPKTDTPAADPSKSDNAAASGDGSDHSASSVDAAPNSPAAPAEGPRDGGAQVENNASDKPADALAEDKPVSDYNGNSGK